MTEKIALSMIVKGTGDEPEKLARALASVAPHVDAIFITLTGPTKELTEVKKICKKYHAQVSYHRALWTAPKDAVDFLTQFFGYAPHMKAGDEIFLFDEARNFNLNQIDQNTYPWIFWMDCDDVLLNGEQMRALVSAAQTNKVEAYYFNYLYQCEMEGETIKNVLIQHLRERLVRNIGVYKWIAPIHETLIEQRPTLKTDTDVCSVLHLSSDGDRMKSLTRNLKSLELAIYQSKGKDPRHTYYLAKAFFDLNTPEYNEKSLKLILDHYVGGDNSSGWQEERGQAWEYTAELFRRKSEFHNAIKSGMNALIEEPENPSAYLSLAHTYMRMQEWERALFWVKIATKIQQKKTTLVVNPKDLQSRTLEIIYNCCLNLSKVDEAWAAIVKLTDLFPDDANLKQQLEFMNTIRTQRDLTEQFVSVADFLKRSGEGAKIKALLSAIPAVIQNNPFMVSLYQQNNPPTVWGKKEIVIYCGPGFTPWSPKKISEPGACFVGGSEEAVCYVSEALCRAGWNVTVYGDPASDEGDIHGVHWLPYYKLNHLDHFNILIGWRDIRFFDSAFDAKKKYLWCHDIQNPIEYTSERIDKIDKVFFLSQWHRENVPALPEEKVFLTSNGIIDSVHEGDQL